MNKLTIRQNALNASSSLPTLLKGDTRILPVPLVPRIQIENQWSLISNPTMRKVQLSKTSKQPGAGLWFSPCLNFVDTDYFQLLVTLSSLSSFSVGFPPTSVNIVLSLILVLWSTVECYHFPGVHYCVSCLILETVLIVLRSTCHFYHGLCMP